MKQKWPWLTLALIYACGFVALAGHTKWADSEIWAISIARTVDFNAWDYGVSYKPLFYALLKILYAPNWDNVSIFNGARVLFALIGLGTLWATWRVGTLLGLSREARLLAIGILALNSFYVERGFRIRSDLLATFLQLVILGVCIGWIHNSRWQMAKYRIWGGLFHIPLLFITPKAIYQLFINFCLLINLEKVSKRVSRLRAAIIIAIPFFALLLLATFRFDQVWSAFTYFVRSFQENPSHPAYFSPQAFNYYGRFLIENPFITAALAWVVLAPLWRRFAHSAPSTSSSSGAHSATTTLTSQQTATQVNMAMARAALVAGLFLLLHNDRLPFFLVAMLPLISLQMGRVLADSFPRPQPQYLFLVGLAVSTIWHARTVWREQNNRLQGEAIHAMSRYLAQYPGIRYYDGTAVLPRENQIYLNIEYTQYGNQSSVMNLLHDQEPDLFFFGNRMHYYFGEIMYFLDHQDYIRIGPGIFAKAKVTYIEDPSKLSKLSRASNSAHMSQKTGSTRSLPESGAARKLREKLCAGLGANIDGLKFYTGVHFTQMRLWNPGEPADHLIACSRFAPIPWPTDRSFAQIFDF